MKKTFIILMLAFVLIVLLGCTNNPPNESQKNSTAQNVSINQTIGGVKTPKNDSNNTVVNVSNAQPLQPPSPGNITNITNVTVPPVQNVTPQLQGCITVANWNLQVFGDSKESNKTLMDTYARILKDYDIVFVQEIRDKDGSAFVSLCDSIPTHNCNVSSRAGRTSSKEQVGVLYKKEISLLNFTDFNPDPQNRWERPPIALEFRTGNYSFRVYNIHTDPDAVPSELTSLEQVVNTEGKVIILGDLNADCQYYPLTNRTHFVNWTWVIPSGADTTVSNTICAYDRIILNQNLSEDFVGYGIRKDGINSSASDHYLVYVNISSK
jgi:deoxyribonuclease-1-like protein